MQVSLFLAKWYGIILLIVAVLTLFRREQFQRLAREILSNTGLLAITGFVSLMLGAAIVIAHPVCELSWRGLITLFGYLELLRGIIRIGFPNIPKRWADKVLSDRSYWIMFIVTLVLGGYLAYFGFWA